MRSERYMRALAKVPPFRDPAVRRRTIGAVRSVRRGRRRLYERFGSDRLSQPSLHGLDRKLERHLPERGGFFVEAGANDGYRQSNTYYLERFKDWTGVLVEPIPSLYVRCVDERPRSKVFNCALVAEGGPTEVTMVDRGLASSMRGDPRAPCQDGDVTYGWEPASEVTVPALTLTSVLETAGAPEIDLLALDVEGYEPEVLQGLDLGLYAPRYVLVEVNSAAAEIEASLGEGYELLSYLSPNDALYARRL